MGPALVSGAMAAITAGRMCAGQARRRRLAGLDLPFQFQPLALQRSAGLWQVLPFQMPPFLRQSSAGSVLCWQLLPSHSPPLALQASAGVWQRPAVPDPALLAGSPRPGRSCCLHSRHPTSRPWPCRRRPGSRRPCVCRPKGRRSSGIPRRGWWAPAAAIVPVPASGLADLFGAQADLALAIPGPAFLAAFFGRVGGRLAAPSSQFQPLSLQASAGLRQRLPSQIQFFSSHSSAGLVGATQRPSSQFQPLACTRHHSCRRLRSSFGPGGTRPGLAADAAVRACCGRSPSCTRTGPAHCVPRSSRACHADRRPSARFVSGLAGGVQVAVLSFQTQPLSSHSSSGFSSSTGVSS